MEETLEQIAEQMARIAERQERLETMLERVLAGEELDLLDVGQVCKVLQVSRTKLNELVQSGQLQMWMLGGERRITRSGLNAFIRRQAGQNGTGKVRDRANRNRVTRG